MKRITKIEVENCRAYFHKYEIPLPLGENLLIYGENGSGKSSLFKSFHHFFKNSLSAQTFSKNLFNSSDNGKIELTFSDLNDSDRAILNSDSYKFSNVDSNNNVPFIKESSLLNGFLDYTDLLKIYLKSEPNPNLFDLIILNLLREFIPVATGESSSLGYQYDFLIKNLITDARTRNSRCHKLGKSRIEDFDRNLRTILDSLFELVNYYLTDFFDLKDISIEYVLKKIEFTYPNGRKSSWFLDTDLKLRILKNGQELGNEYKDYLNEARLSSFAVCLYIASLKLFPSDVEYKLIYLDDIFIGLDTANRIPILKILRSDFSDYQIFISTYDKHFFEVCNQILGKGTNLWKAIEIYVGEYLLDDNHIDVPIVLSHNNDLSKARYYLYNNDRPDYPASANYFRKYLENRLKEVFPSELFRNDELEEIESFRLSKILKICITFLANLGLTMDLLNDIQSYLFILLHPLSHYHFSSNTYKRDLKEVDKKIKELFEDENTFQFLKNIKFCVAKKGTVRIDYEINQYNVWFYEFYLEDSLFYDLSRKVFSEVKVVGTKYHCIKNKKTQKGKTLNKGTSNIKYDSLFHAYEGVSNLILTNHYRFFKKKENFYDCVKIFNGADWIHLLPSIS